eukprot:jgi/Mesen1/3639/ME000020S03171
MAADNAEQRLLQALHSDREIADTGEWASSIGIDHASLVGPIKSLLAHEYIIAQDVNHQAWLLTAEAEQYAKAGSPEVQVFEAIPQEGLAIDELKARLGPLADIGQKQALANRWLTVVKGGPTPMLQRKALPQAELDALQKKRKLITPRTWRTYRVAKGPKFQLEKKKPATDLTHDLLLGGAWKEQEFKQYNFKALGQPVDGGHLHPLLKARQQNPPYLPSHPYSLLVTISAFFACVRAQFRKIFLELGFEEMPTNNFVESRGAAPATTRELPEDYVARVKAIHEHGGHGSAGYGYDWKRAEADKNLLRTHTTAVSSRMLYKLAQYFSIDRVFRNEAVDRTHLAEFHQIEGVICDRGITLGDLIGTLNTFFGRLGIKKLRFKPAYNPYTEPSMEIFSYHEELKKWVEVGNSGMFRPEMLRPMGLPEDVSVIAWGLSLERPTMILYHIDNIRDLFGHKVDLKLIRSNPICRLGL